MYEPPLPIRSLRSDLPVEVETAINRALAKEPGARYTSTIQFAQALTMGEVIEPVTLVAPVREMRLEIERLFRQVVIGSEEEAKAARMALVRIGAPVVEALFESELRFLGRPWHHIALDTVREIGTAAIEPLLRLVRKGIVMLPDDGYTRDLGLTEVGELLGELGDESTVEPLIQILLDPKCPWVGQVAVAAALGEIGDIRAVEPLIQELRGEWWLVRDVAAEALGKIDVPAVEPLIGVLRDPDAGARRGAAWALGKIGASQALPYLRWVVENDAVSNVQSAAQEAIEWIQEKARRV